MLTDEETRTTVPTNHPQAEQGAANVDVSALALGLCVLQQPGVGATQYVGCLKKQSVRCSLVTSHKKKPRSRATGEESGIIWGPLCNIPKRKATFAIVTLTRKCSTSV